LAIAIKPRAGRHLVARLGVFAIAFVLLALAINYRLIFEFGIFATSMKYHGATPLLGHGGMRMIWPSGYYGHVIHQLAGGHIELLAVGAVLLGITRLRRSLPHLIPIVLAGLCTLLLFGLRSAFPRYALPAIVLLTVTAALGIAWTSRLLPLRARAAWVAALVLLCGALQWRTCSTFLHEFDDDSRERLRTWMAANLRAGDRVAADTYAGRFWAFGGEQTLTIGPLIRMDAAASVADLRGNLADLRAAGYTHVAVCAAAFERYFNPELMPLPEQTSDFRRRQAFYRELFDRGQLVWQSEPELDTMAYTNPPLRLYRLSELSLARSN